MRKSTRVKRQIRERRPRVQHSKLVRDLVRLAIECFESHKSHVTPQHKEDLKQTFTKLIDQGVYKDCDDQMLVALVVASNLLYRYRGGMIVFAVFYGSDSIDQKAKKKEMKGLRRQIITQLAKWLFPPRFTFNIYNLILSRRKSKKILNKLLEKYFPNLT